MDTDLNLLFGVLAMQLEFIDSRQFTAACGLWSLEKTRPLADILSDQKWLSAADREIVEGLVQRKLKKHSGDSRETLGAEADVEARDSMRDVDDEDVNHTLSFLPPSIAHVRVGQVEDTLNYEPETRSRYTLTRVHGEGGVGRVWRAHDNRLNRLVALKEIRPDRRVSVSSWQRFIKEAQVTGQLEHPNIVPVYEMTAGAGEDEETFYTMRFVSGRTLGAEITEYRRRRRAGKASPLQLRRLLQAFCGVCNAMAYAHSRGVVHRDLKPANVMLGPFGEVVVLDWGLAKMVDQPESDEESLEVTPISVTDEASSHQTVDGNVLGTLSYMSPEQAAGRLELIDRRTDVYGLGAILFALVSGRHPHSSKQEDTEHIRQRIVGEPTPAAHEMEPSVPKALSAICAKAMCKDRGGRYQSAQELGEEVQRWLGDEPVSSYQESLSERFGRVTRRHRTLTQAVAASLLVIAVVSSVAFFLVRNARENEQVARRDALRRLHEARESVDRSLTSTADVLNYFPGARVLRLQLLEQAALEYEKFVGEDSTDPEIRAETARAWVRLGDLRQLLAQDEKAEQAYRQGEAWFRDLAAESNHRVNRMELAYCLAHRADLYRTQDKTDQARTLLSEAHELAADSDQVPEYRLMKGHVLFKQAQLEQHVGAFDASLALFGQAEEFFDQLVARTDDPQHNEYRNWLAKSRSLQGQVNVEKGEHAIAVTFIEQAIKEYDALVAADSDSVPYLEGLAFSRINLANAISVLAREEEQQIVLQEAIADFSGLLTTMPGVAHFRQSRGIALAELGTSFNRYGYNADAQLRFEAAFADFNALFKIYDDPDDFHLLAVTSVRRGQVLRDIDDDDEANLAFTGAIDAYQQSLLIRYPDDVEYRRGLGVAHRQLGLLYYKMGRFKDNADGLEDARAECKLAIAAFDNVLETSPEDPYSVLGKANAWEYLGDIDRAQERPDQAQANYQSAIALRESVQDHPEFRLRLIKLRLKSTHPDDRAHALNDASALSDEFPQSGEFLTALGAAQYIAGHLPASIASLEKAGTMRVPQNSSHDLWLALAHLGRADESGAEGELEKAQAAYQRGIERMRVAAPGHVELLELRRRVETKLADANQP